MAKESSGKSGEWKVGARSLVSASWFKVTLLGLAIRLLVAPFSTGADSSGWFAGARMIASLSLQQALTAGTTVPVFWWMNALIYGAWHLLTGKIEPFILWPLWPDYLLNCLLKIPAITADILTGVVLYQILRRLGRIDQAIIALKLWMFNPLVIGIVAMWGSSWDIVSAFFALLAIYLYAEHRPYLSALSLGLGIAWKLWPAILLPVFLVDLIKEKQKLRMVPIVAISALPLIVVSLPRLVLAPVAQPATTFSEYAEIYWIFGYNIGSDWAPGYVPLTLSIMVLLVFLVLQSWHFEDNLERINQFAICLLMTYFGLSIIAMQFSIWPLPFLILDYARNRKKGYIFWGYTGAAIASLIFGWAPSSFIYLLIPPSSPRHIFGSEMLISQMSVGLVDAIQKVSRGIFCGSSLAYVAYGVKRYFLR
nr:hypothetical protein [Candidatus Njordarchaeum guaymaensis]